MDTFQKILELRQKQIKTALVTVIKTEGSVPREAGTKMLVEENGKIHGTIGGSILEAMVIKEAQDSIKNGNPVIVSHDLHDKEGKDTGMVCGGKIDFFIEPLSLTERLYIFGGGHVSLHLAKFASMVGFDYVVIDDRPEFASEQRFPDAVQVIVEDPAKAASELTLSNTDYVAIVTRRHEDDYNSVRAVINKPARYIGMIASKTKRHEIFTKLREQDGVTDDLLAKVHSPIGLDIGAETPEEIAVSIVAELIKVRSSPKGVATREVGSKK
jgi:xanthine dehydrogenase accessory factor